MNFISHLLRWRPRRPCVECGRKTKFRWGRVPYCWIHMQEAVERAIWSRQEKMRADLERNYFSTSPFVKLKDFS